MKEGDRVCVISNHNTYRKYHLEEGVVERYKNDWNSIGVRLDNFTNKASGYGLFWFKHNQIVIIKEEQIMLQNFIPVKIRFLEGQNIGQSYHYALYDENIHIGDTVLVATGHHGLALAQVFEPCVNDAIERKKVMHGREIVCKIDMSAYNKRREDEKRAAQLKELMDGRVKELQADAVLIMMAEKDPALAAMLKEFQMLTNGNITTAAEAPSND